MAEQTEAIPTGYAADLADFTTLAEQRGADYAHRRFVYYVGARGAADLLASYMERKG